MKTTRLLVIFFTITVLNGGAANASEHHSGHGGGPKSGGAGAAGACGKPHLGKFLPAHLTKVVPGSEFSFLAFNIDKPEQISVTAKNIPVEVTAEFKDPFYLVKGKLPATLVNTAARINIKVSAKSPHCEAENGWLLIIADQ